MDQFRLGATVLHVSRVCLGTMSYGSDSDRPLIPQCVDQGVGVIPWSPLARGFLTGTRTRSGERRTTRAEDMARLEEPYVPHPVLGHG
jgi:aryl-alcohol dehydrogenase-like predicted oxidoreductase